MDSTPPLLWYASYGSNMDADRFGLYLHGGALPGTGRTYPGSRDPAPPRATAPVHLPGEVYFAGRSSVWGGGMALYDPHGPGTAPGRAYLVSRTQFSDVVAQEMRRPPETDLDVAAVLARGRDELGPGPYDTLVAAGTVAGVPVLTFTSAARAAASDLAAPTGPYLAMLGAGLAAAHGWDRDRVATYLASRPGAAGHWSPDQVAAVLR